MLTVCLTFKDLIVIQTEIKSINGLYKRRGNIKWREEKEVNFQSYFILVLQKEENISVKSKRK